MILHENLQKLALEERGFISVRCCCAQAIKLMQPPVEQWVWVSDFYGFGFSDLNPRIADTFLDLSAKHYPERLGAFLVVGAPFIFNGLWSVVQPLVDSATRKKIHMLT